MCALSRSQVRSGDAERFYRLFSFFNSVNETGQIPYSGVPSPSLLVTNGTSAAQSTDAEIAPLESSVSPVALCDGVDPAGADWKARECGAFSGWLTAAARTSTLVPPGLFAYLPLDGSSSTPVPPKRDPKTHELSKPDVKVTFVNLVPGKKPATLEGDKDRVPKTVPGHSGNAQLLVATVTSIWETRPGSSSGTIRFHCRCGSGSSARASWVRWSRAARSV